MQIVIDIPNYEFDNDIADKFQDYFSRVKADISNGDVCGNYELETTDMFLSAFKRLKVLPKAHGRLGDLDAVEAEMINGIKAGNYEEGYERYGHVNNMNDCVECVKFAPTIIEADKAESEEEE